MVINGVNDVNDDVNDDVDKAFWSLVSPMTELLGPSRWQWARPERSRRRKLESLSSRRFRAGFALEVPVVVP